MLISIIFSLGDNYYNSEPSSNWISFLINLSGVLIGAFLAYLIALFIDKKQRRDEKNIELNKQFVLSQERLKHLSTLIDNAIDIAEKQGRQYFDLSNQITMAPHEKHLVTITLTNDFERIEKLDTQKIFEAYTSIVGSNSENIKNYSILFHQLDFISIKLQQMFDMHEKHNNFTFNDQCFIRDLIDGLITELIILVIELPEFFPDDFQDRPLYSFVTDLLGKTKIDDSRDMLFFKNEFLIPLRDNSRTMFGFNKSLSNLILRNTKLAITRYNNIEINSAEHSRNCANFKTEIEPTIQKLKILNDEIKINVP